MSEVPTCAMCGGELTPTPTRSDLYGCFNCGVVVTVVAAEEDGQ